MTAQETEASDTFSSIGNTLQSLANEIYTHNVKQGFWPENPRNRNYGEAMALIISEVSESLEEHRNKNLTLSESAFYLGEKGKPEGWATELIDAVIRILDVLGGLLPEDSPRVDEILEIKLRYNLSRPYRHGRNY